MTTQPNPNPSPPILSRVLSNNLDDALTPGVMVEVDPAEAEALGAFEETALSEQDAWEANADLPAVEGASDGQ